MTYLKALNAMKRTLSPLVPTGEVTTKPGRSRGNVWIVSTLADWREAPGCLFINFPNNVEFSDASPEQWKAACIAATEKAARVLSDAGFSTYSPVSFFNDISGGIHTQHPAGGLYVNV